MSENLHFDKNFTKKLIEKIPSKVSNLKLYFREKCNGFVRFDNNLLTSIYINGKINDITKKDDFEYKNLYKGTEKYVTLKFEYISNDFVFSKIYIKSNYKDEFGNYYEYRYDSDLNLESKYFGNILEAYNPTNILLDEIKAICNQNGENWKECMGGFSKIEEDGKKIKNKYFLFSEMKKFDDFFKILKTKKIVIPHNDFDNKCRYGIKENGDVIYLGIMPKEMGEF
jgi:hypothetical protein